MDRFGLTRSAIAADHALIAPDSHVETPLPGWTGTTGVVLISPALGAGFSQVLATMEPGAVAGEPLPGVERFAFVERGTVETEIDGEARELEAGGYLYAPPGRPLGLTAAETSRLILFERRWTPAPGVEPPAPVVGREAERPGEPFLGDPDARLQKLLPESPEHDMAVNLFTFEVGASLPFVEVHVMEHGLTFLAGRGVYRLGDAWYPVVAGDTIWMAPFCPQWFGALGKEPARYLYYKDVQRDPLAGGVGAPESGG